MPDLQIIGGPQSNFVWVTRIVLAEKRVDYTVTAVMPHTPQVDVIHPFGKIPAMRHGDFTLCESRAICAYVDRTFDGPSLIPTDLRCAAQTEQWISLFTTTIDPVSIRPYLGGYLFPGTPAAPIGPVSTALCPISSGTSQCSTAPSPPAIWSATPLPSPRPM
jgi:glutathione S-transferase